MHNRNHREKKEERRKICEEIVNWKTSQMLWKILIYRVEKFNKVHIGSIQRVPQLALKVNKAASRRHKLQQTKKQSFNRLWELTVFFLKSQHKESRQKIPISQTVSERGLSACFRNCYQRASLIIYHTSKGWL